MKDSAFLGTEVKYLVQIEASGFDMTTDDFEITIKRGKIEHVFTKSDLVDESYTEEGEVKHNYYLCFDTAEFGKGTLTCIVRAYVPDTDFPDGLRTEVDMFDLIDVRQV